MGGSNGAFIEYMFKVIKLAYGGIYFFVPIDYVYMLQHATKS